LQEPARALVLRARWRSDHTLMFTPKVKKKDSHTRS
jgi:hypothetical protein